MQILPRFLSEKLTLPRRYVYLWHMLDPDKYQYPKSIVGTHEFDEPSEHVGMSAMEDEQVEILLNMPDFDTFNEMVRWVYEQGCWATFKSNYAMWRDQFIERKQNRRFAIHKLDPVFRADFVPIENPDFFNDFHKL